MVIIDRGRIAARDSAENLRSRVGGDTCVVAEIRGPAKRVAGMLESMLTVAPEQYVIDDEIIGMACKVLKGIEVDAEHLAAPLAAYLADTVEAYGRWLTAQLRHWQQRNDWLEKGTFP